MRIAQDETIRWPAGIDHNLAHTIETRVQEPAHGVNRRILLALLTLDSEELFEGCKDKPEAMFEAFKCSASTVAMYKRLVSLMDTAHTRLMVALCEVDYEAPDAPFSEEDFEAAIEEAQAEDVNDKVLWPPLRLVSDESSEGGES